MKKFMITLILASGSFSLLAQTEAGKVFVGANTNLSFASQSFEGQEDNDNSFEVELSGGYFIIDNLLGGIDLAFVRAVDNNDFNTFTSTSIGAGPFVRYYYESVFAGAGVTFLRSEFEDDNDNSTTISGNFVNFELGYALFLNEVFSIEPGIGFTLLNGDFDGNIFDISIGIGIYL